jgi:hypothetical protein
MAVSADGRVAIYDGTLLPWVNFIVLILSPRRRGISLRSGKS